MPPEFSPQVFLIGLTNRENWKWIPWWNEHKNKKKKKERTVSNVNMVASKWNRIRLFLPLIFLLFISHHTCKMNETCWALMSDLLLWTPTHGHTSVGWLVKTYFHQLYENTGYHLEKLPRVMDSEKTKEFALSVQHDDDDDDIYLYCI